MLKTYQFKTHCKGDSHSSKTANIILPGFIGVRQGHLKYHPSIERIRLPIGVLY